jgi:histidinol-phosphatase (PHP family)
MLTNYHTHTLWCDGKDTPETVVLSAIEKGFDAIGFSSHMAFPFCSSYVIDPKKGEAYADEIRALKIKYASRIKVHLGGEADYIPAITTPEKSRYQHLGLEYLIGSVHCTVAPSGEILWVDNTPDILMDGIKRLYGGDVKKFISEYFRLQREIVRDFDFDFLAHPDLIRKFNSKYPFFDESEKWYISELENTADAIAISGKKVEVNTGAISRGWMSDAYPSKNFRDILRDRGVKFILSSDAHTAQTIDCAFDRFGECENFVSLFD